MRIQHNIMAMGAYRNYTNNVNAMKKNLEKLSSGYKINRAGDDAAGLAISEKMRAQITGLETAQKNAKDGISLVQTAEGALTEVHDMLNRMVTLATQSANGTYDNEVDRVQLQKELDQLRTEIDRIADSSNFNGIKLFDGSLSGADITTNGIEVSQVDMAKGIEVVQGTNGGGSNGTFTINLDSAMSDGDKLTLTFGGQVATDGTGTLDLTYNSGTNAATTGKIEAGATIEDQATNIMKALKANSNVAKHFDVTVDGTSVILTAKIEGNKTAANSDSEPITSTVTNATITDIKATSSFDNTTTVAKDATDGVAKFGGMFEAADGSGLNISKGDILTFEVKVGNQTMTLTAEAGKDFEVKDTQENTGTELINFLNDKATFADDPSTFIDESKIKFGDLFTAAVDKDTTNKTTGLSLTQKSGLVNQAAANVAATEIKITNQKPDGITIDATATKGTASTAANSVAGEYTLELVAADATHSGNLSNGDKLTIEGELLDGRTFKFDVEAGKDFQVGKDYNETIKNLKTLLESDSYSVELKNADGTEAKAAKGSDIFGDNAEIKIDTTANAEKFVSTAKGTMASGITKLTLTNGAAAEVSANLKNGDQKTSADSTITLSEGVGYGAIVEVDGKKYELVKTAGDVSNANNKAVIVDDISDVSSAAKALANAIKGDLGDTDYKVTSSGGKVTIATKKVGSTAQAVSASASGDKTTQLEFTLDPKKMQEGTTVTINGQTYEFTKDGKASDNKNIGIKVADFAKETASSLGSALAKVANGQNNASVTVDGDGKVTVRGLVDSETNEIVVPSAKFDGGTSGLTLQIGDTADDYNKMRVSIYKMKCADMGIGDISILDQDSAGAAIDKIKSAINYVSDVRGTLGATQNRLDHTINNLSVMQENIQDAESTIRDTDVAAEMMAYTKNNILIQSAQAMLAQANQVPQGVLQLLQ